MGSQAIMMGVWFLRLSFVFKYLERENGSVSTHLSVRVFMMEFPGF